MYHFATELIVATVVLLFDFVSHGKARTWTTTALIITLKRNLHQLSSLQCSDSASASRMNGSARYPATSIGYTHSSLADTCDASDLATSASERATHNSRCTHHFTNMIRLARFFLLFTFCSGIKQSSGGTKLHARQRLERPQHRRSSVGNP